MMPFASNLRSELVVDAPDSMTSDTDIYETVIGNKTLEKSSRMEDISFQQGIPPHREIDFNQGIPVRVKEKSRTR